MTIYNESLENIIENPDLEKGHLEEAKKFVKHHEEQQQEVKYEVMEGTITKANPKGLRREVIVVPYKAAYDEYETVQKYIPYTEEELAAKKAEQSQKQAEENQKHETARKPVRIEELEAQITYTAMMTDTLLNTSTDSTNESGD